MLSAASLASVVTGIAIVDDTCRRYLLNALHGDFPSAPALPDLRLLHLTRTIGDALGLPIGSQGPLMIFAAFGIVLFVMLFRS